VGEDPCSAFGFQSFDFDTKRQCAPHAHMKTMILPLPPDNSQPDPNSLQDNTVDEGGADDDDDDDDDESSLSTKSLALLVLSK
jgi:hypothetical protein